MPSPPLNVERSSASDSPPSAPSSRITDGIGQLAGWSRAPSPSGRARGTLPGQAPAGDVGHAPRSAPPSRRRAGAAGSPGSRSASASAGPRPGCSPPSPARASSPGPRIRRDQVRIALAQVQAPHRRRSAAPARSRCVEPRGGEARSARRPALRGRPVHQPVALHDADAEAGQVELVGLHQPRVLGRLAADERAAGQPAAVGHRADDRRDALRARLGRRPRSRGRRAARRRRRPRRPRTSPRGRARSCRSGRAPSRWRSSSPRRPWS